MVSKVRSGTNETDKIGRTTRLIWDREEGRLVENAINLLISRILPGKAIGEGDGIVPTAKSNTSSFSR